MKSPLKLKAVMAMTVAALIMICSTGAWAQQRMSDSEYKRLLKSSSEYAAADREMTRVWKSLPSQVRKSELPYQREWIRTGRDQDAYNYIRRGASRAEAYTRATRMRLFALQDLTANPSQRPPVTTLPGHVRPGYGQYTFDQADRELNQYWNSISPGVRSQLLPEQRQWVSYGRERAARVYQRQGLSRDQALARATMDRTQAIRDYVRGRY